MGNYLAKQVYIKNLLIFQSETAYGMFEQHIISAKQKGVYIEELAMNPYLYETRSLDIPFIMNYIQCLDNMAGIFRNLYDDNLYNLRLEGLINYSILDRIYQEDVFHNIFNAVNNTFNAYLDDDYLFIDFGIYQSSTSLETITALYETFNDQFISIFKNYVDIKILRSRAIRNIKFLHRIYNEIFELFEPIYLPFY